jgi:hypothetical protein
MFLIFLMALFILITQAVLARDSKPAVPFKKVVIVVLENAELKDALATSYLGRTLPKMGASFENFHGITHPSFPNYLALVAGTTFGIGDNRNYDLDAPSIADLLESTGKTWKTYAEQFPGNCFLGRNMGDYYRKHNPFISFVNISSNPKRCANIVEEKNFVRDFRAGQLPDYTLYIPDNLNNGHDTGVEFASRYVERLFGPLLLDTAAMKDMLFVFTYDEDAGGEDNTIYTVFYGPGVKPDVRITTYYNHYNLLKTIQHFLNLGTLNQNDEKAEVITGIWK